jgi:hypothetical protein
MIAFEKEFGSIWQGVNKTGTIRMNAMFVMDSKNVTSIPKNQPPTYAKVVFAYRPQKEDPNCIRITDRGNLINYPGKLTIQTANITTAKLHWNSILLTPKAKYMCLVIVNFYLTATLDQYECMKMLITLFPPWVIKQYDPHSKVVKGFIYLQMRNTIWGLPQTGILANKLLGNVLLHTVITNAKILQAYGNTRQDQFLSPLASTILA